MRIHRVWWSKRKPTLPFTIFTSTDLGRLKNLEAQCRSLSGGVLSGAVYLPLYEPNPVVESGLIKLSPDNQAALQNASATVEALFLSLENAAPRARQQQQEQSAPQQKAPARRLLQDSGRTMNAQKVEEGGSWADEQSAAADGQLGRDVTAENSEELLEGLAAAVVARRHLSDGELRRLLKEEVYSFEKLAAKAPRAPPSPPPPPPSVGPPCSLRISLLYEIVADEPMVAVFPVNMLRNAGRLGATTPLISMLDVDLSVSWGLTNRVLSDDARTEDMQRRGEADRAVWVLPAFDTEKHLSFEHRNRAADEVVALRPEEKQHLINMWLFRHEILAFNFDSHKRGHNSTNYERWFTALSEYTVIYEQAYEPWFIAARKVLPPYDARFRGYGLNKIALGEYMGLTGFNFRVLPDAWIVHRPHDPTPTCMACARNAEQKNASNVQVLYKPIHVQGAEVRAREAFVGKNVKFYNDFRQGMRTGTYHPVQDAQSKHCQEVLSWWQW